MAESLAFGLKYQKYIFQQTAPPLRGTMFHTACANSPTKNGLSTGYHDNCSPQSLLRRRAQGVLTNTPAAHDHIPYQRQQYALCDFDVCCCVMPYFFVETGLTPSLLFFTV